MGNASDMKWTKQFIFSTTARYVYYSAKCEISSTRLTVILKRAFHYGPCIAVTYFMCKCGDAISN